jgi:hypothetical protein
MTLTESVLEDEGMFKKIFLVISILMTGIGIFLIIIGSANEKKINSDIYTLDVFDPESFKPGINGNICVDPDTIFTQQNGLSSMTWMLLMR